MIYIIDLFCGAGGLTTGANKVYRVKVVACVNHDEMAIKSHSANHPECKHFTEDIRWLNLQGLIDMVKEIRANDPDAIIQIHASLECTNFSKAKGGLPRNADSRTLAEHLIESPHPDDVNKPKREQRMMPRYIPLLNPDIISIENVEEFMSWGPLDTKGKPVSRKAGRDYIKWIEQVCSYGYEFEHRILNAADFGAFTSRKRYFGQFVKPGIRMQWPEPTHSKRSTKTKELFGNNLKDWNAVRDVLDLDDHGPSMFEPGRITSDNTWGRVLHGGIKFVAGGKENYLKRYLNYFHPFVVHPNYVDESLTVWGGGKSGQHLIKYNSINRNGKYNAPGIEEPSPVVSTQNRLGLISPQFITKYYSGKPEYKNQSLDQPGPTIRTVDGTAIVSTDFLLNYQHSSKANSLTDPAPTITTKDKYSFVTTYHGNGANIHSLDGPSPTIPTKDSAALIQPQPFITRDFSGGGQLNDIALPAGTVLPYPKMNLVTPEPFIYRDFGNSTNQSLDQPAGSLLGDNPHMQLITPSPWILNPNYNNVGNGIDEPAAPILASRKHYYLMNPQYGGGTRSIDDPCFTLIARMDKSPPYLIEVQPGQYAITIDESDTPNKRKVKEFMAMYGIIDFKMRMLNIPELKRIQGFPEDYILEGTKTQQKKFLGNAVEVNMAYALISAIAEGNLKEERKTA